MFCSKMRTIKIIMSAISIMFLVVAMHITFYIEAYAKVGNETQKVELVSSDTTEIFFEDAVGHWAEDYINAAAKKQLFKGDIYGKFNPDDNITRAQFVAVLWRMAGSPAVDHESTFTDVMNQTEEFCSAIAWAHSKGYISGVSKTVFAPTASLTREAAMNILYLYSGDESNEAFKFSMIYDKIFSDSKDVSHWAKKAVHWGLYNELINGTSATTLTPKGRITRAQLAKILIKYIETTW